MWDRSTRDEIIAAGGSVQRMERLPTALREVYKTAWEMKQRVLIDMAADRGKSGQLCCYSWACVLEAHRPAIHTLRDSPLLLNP